MCQNFIKGLKAHQGKQNNIWVGVFALLYVLWNRLNKKGILKANESLKKLNKRVVLNVRIVYLYETNIVMILKQACPNSYKCMRYKSVSNETVHIACFKTFLSKSCPWNVNWFCLQNAFQSYLHWKLSCKRIRRVK